MVQREIADRLRASPGSRTYGAPSVLVQLACEIELLRTVDRAVFRPRPRVDSALLRLRRRAAAAPPALAGFVRDGFAHRRKPIAGSLELAGGPSREAVRGALQALGLEADARAEALAPAEFVRARGALGGPLTLRAPAKLNLCLYLGPRRDDGLHEIRSLFCPLTLADRIVVTDAGEDQVVCPGVEEPNLAGEALTALRARGWRRAPARVEIEKRIPVAAGLGGGSADAAALLRLARDEVDGLAELAADLGADVPSQLDPAFALVGGAGEAVEPLPPPRRVRRGAPARPRTACAPPTSTRRPTGWASAATTRSWMRLPRAARGRGGGASPLDYAELLVNDLGEAALSLRPEIGGGARRAAGGRGGGRAGHRVRPDGLRPLRGHRRRRPGRRGAAAALRERDRGGGRDERMSANGGSRRSHLVQLIALAVIIGVRSSRSTGCFRTSTSSRRWKTSPPRWAASRTCSSGSARSSRPGPSWGWCSPERRW